MKALLVALTALTIFFGQTPWGHLVEKAAQSDYVLHTPYGDYHVLKHIVPEDTAQTHDAEYFSAVGGMFKGKFYTDHVEMVSEHWVREGNIWTVDQWLFTVSINGELLRTSHNNLREDMNGTVLPSPYPPAPTEAEAGEMFKKIGKEWEDFTA